MMDANPEPAAAVDDEKFFQRADWLTFCATTAMVFAVYLLTLAPNVGLGLQGVFATGANFGGVPHPPGHPLWTIYAGVFTKFLPFSNIAWRANVAAALAGALACGVIALLVSRCGARMADGLGMRKPISARDGEMIRVVCGTVAGMGFGFDGAFWGKVVAADPWPLSILMLGLTICWLTRWQHHPARTRWLLLGALGFGLALTNSQILILAAPGLPVFALGGLPNGFATRGKLAARCAAMLLPGLLLYFYLPVVSMTNPPMNWGYARTVEGFDHVVTRGQYEAPRPSTEPDRLMEQLGDYSQLAADDLGELYLLAALGPFCLAPWMQLRDRRWMLAMLAVFLGLSVTMVFLLNPGFDREARRAVTWFYTASHLVLAVWAGCGLVLIARLACGTTGETR